MRKFIAFLLVVVSLFALSACSDTPEDSSVTPENSSVTSVSTLKGKAGTMHFLELDIKSNGFKRTYYFDVEFEYINENLIKVTQSNGGTYYHSASLLESMSSVTFYD